MLQEPADPALLYFREIVEPTVAEFMENRADKRRGCLACLALASMTEHYFRARPEHTAAGQRACDALSAFKGKVRAENKALGWIADVANATKHVVRYGKPDALKIGYGDVRTEEMGRAGVLRAGWPIAGEEVLVGADREWRLSVLIEAAMKFWRSELNLISRSEDTT